MLRREAFRLSPIAALVFIVSLVSAAAALAQDQAAREVLWSGAKAEPPGEGATQLYVGPAAGTAGSTGARHFTQASRRTSPERSAPLPHAPRLQPLRSDMLDSATPPESPRLTSTADPEFSDLTPPSDELGATLPAGKPAVTTPVPERASRVSTDNIEPPLAAALDVPIAPTLGEPVAAEDPGALAPAIPNLASLVAETPLPPTPAEIPAVEIGSAAAVSGLAPPPFGAPIPPSPAEIPVPREVASAAELAPSPLKGPSTASSESPEPPASAALDDVVVPRPTEISVVEIQSASPPFAASVPPSLAETPAPQEAARTAAELAPVPLKGPSIASSEGPEPPPSAALDDAIAPRPTEVPASVSPAAPAPVAAPDVSTPPAFVPATTGSPAAPAPAPPGFAPPTPAESPTPTTNPQPPAAAPASVQSPTSPPASPQRPAAPAFADLIKNAVDALAKTDIEVKGTPATEIHAEIAAIAAYYAARDYAPLWIENGKPTEAVRVVMDRLAQAGDDGLNLSGLPVPVFAAGEDELATAEVALSAEVVAYGRQASGCRVDPQTISALIGAKPDLPDPALILAAVAAAGDDGGLLLESFNPPQKPYLALRSKLAALRAAKSVAVAPIPLGRAIRVGMRDPRVPLIRARFGLGADAGDGTSHETYDTRLAAVVADFQRTSGLPDSGVLTARTAAMLSEPSWLENEIIANMERWRWMPREIGTSRIEVNIPDFMATVIQDGRIVSRNKVIVGKPDTPTPIFSDAMKFLIVNPYWNVPPSIVRKEMLPRVGGNPYYLTAMGFEVFTRNGQLVVRQPPGERNALGRIKFMFPNHYSVYLHDTPSRGLFAAARRAFSHGCVRVDQPFAFAQSLLGPEWPEERIKHLIGDAERYVYLPKPLPIHIEYFTASIDDGGRLQLRDDLYGYSHKVKIALGLESDDTNPVEALLDDPGRPSRSDTVPTADNIDPEPGPPTWRRRAPPSWRYEFTPSEAAPLIAGHP